MESLQKIDDGQSSADPADKRSCPRYPFSPPVEAHDIQADIRIVGRLSDIARNGCYMETISPFAARAAVTLTITCDDESFKTQAKVVHSDIGMGMGLLFTTAEPEGLRLLGAWLSHLGGGKQRERDESDLLAQPDVPKNTDHKLRDVVSDLIVALIRKSVVSDSQGKTMLRKLSG
jgi:hypothetical protein